MVLSEIRWHGRGGQGVVTACTLLAEAAIAEKGKWGQAFPEFGPERSGAPLKGFTRIADEPISLHSKVYEPDYSVVLDPTLIGKVDLTKGLKKALIANWARSKEKLQKRVGFENVLCVSATNIALKEIGRPITNTPMMGALVKVSKLVKLENLKEEIRARFAEKLPEKILKGNLKAVERGYKEVK